MPICRTCRGEYARREAKCPTCGKPVGRVIDVCRRCGTDVEEKRLCPRCKSDVSVWEQEEMALLEFVLARGGILGLFPAAMALFMLLFFWYPREASLYYYPVLTFASFGVSLLAFFVLYIKRLFWWERWWASQVYRATPVPIVLAIVITALGGIFLFALWVFMYAAWGKPVAYGRKLSFALVYVASYTLLTIALTLLGIQSYVAHLNQYVPQPLFVDTKQLIRVVAESVISSVTPDTARDDAANVTYEVQETQRIPDTGGILVLVRERRYAGHPDENGEIKEIWEEILWRVQADRWGRVQIIQPGNPQAEPRQPRDVQEFGRYS